MIHEGFAQKQRRQATSKVFANSRPQRSEGKRHFFARKKEQADMTHVITCSPQPYIYARILDSNKFSFSLRFPVARFRRNQHILIINTQTLNLLYFVGHCNLHLAGSDHDFLMRPKLSLKNISVWWRRRSAASCLSLSGSPAMSLLFRMIDYTQRILLASVCLIRRIQFIQWYEWYRRRNKFISVPSRKRKYFIC